MTPGLLETAGLLIGALVDRPDHAGRPAIHLRQGLPACRLTQARLSNQLSLLSSPPGGAHGSRSCGWFAARGRGCRVALAPRLRAGVPGEKIRRVEADHIRLAQD